MKLQLTHFCHHPAARGVPGDVVDCRDEAFAQRLLDQRGAVKVGESAPAPVVETAAVRTSAPAGRGRGGRK